MSAPRLVLHDGWRLLATANGIASGLALGLGVVGAVEEHSAWPALIGLGECVWFVFIAALCHRKWRAPSAGGRQP